MELSRSEREATLARTPSEWHVMIRHENARKRLIERKVRLLEQIQERRQREQRAASPVADASSAPTPTLRDVI